MEVFNIIVGIATIIGAVGTTISFIILASLNSQIKNLGDNNINNTQQNRGVQNKSKIINRIKTER